MAESPEKMMTETNKLVWIALVFFSGWLIYQLSPVLIPFFISALLAYLGDPIVDKLEAKNLSRTVSVSIVFAVLFLVVLVVLLVVIPLLTAQIGALFRHLPDYLSAAHAALVPWLNSVGFPVDIFDIELIKRGLVSYWSEVSHVATSLVEYMSRSSLVVLQWLANLILIPVVTFYLLRDWDLLVARFRALLPRTKKEVVIKLSLECDEMLAAFIRGQLMVMLVLAIIYTTGLSLIGLELALLLGVIAGIVSFVPYLGLIVGIALAGLAAFFQFHDWSQVVMVMLVFGFAQVIEGMVLTPRLVGEKIGLHPVAVIFSVLAGGQLFGFIGVLMALPIAAVLKVLLNHSHQHSLDKHVN